MNDICPHCSRTATPPPNATNEGQACPHCGQDWIDGSLPSASGNRPPSRLRQRLVLGVVALGLFLIGGAWYASHQIVGNQEIEICIDNGGSETLTVELNDWKVATVPPGQFQMIMCGSGQRHIVVRRGEDVVIDRVEQLPYPGEKVISHYLLNPGKTRRYYIYTVNYEKVGMINEWNWRQALGDVHSDDLEWVKKEYARLADALTLLAPMEWQRLDAEVILTEPPEKVTLHEGSNRTSLRVLARLEEADHTFLVQAKKKANPTYNDLVKLAVVIESIQTIQNKAGK